MNVSEKKNPNPMKIYIEKKNKRMSFDSEDVRFWTVELALALHPWKRRMKSRHNGFRLEDLATQRSPHQIDAFDSEMEVLIPQVRK